jgi:alpha-galactosidase
MDIDFICVHLWIILSFNLMQIKFTEDFPITDLANQNWTIANETSIKKYWSGEIAPLGRHFKTRLLWSDSALYVRFEANQNEPLIISETPNLSSKTHGLWERDVCEIFLAPNSAESRRYFEFEVAPTGEWIDLQIHQLPDKRETDFEYDSGMQTAAKIEDNKIWLAFKIEWKGFGKTPKAGKIWKGNIFRCIGAGENRGYLAWQPTMTEKPNFHVPEKFGEFEFVK